ncbi:MAG: sensor histidine kinase [Gemmatimonadaceae bacterium]
MVPPPVPSQPVRAVPPEALRVVPMFKDLAEDELAFIAARAELMELEPGEPFFVPGEPAAWMFISLEGTLQARRQNLGPDAPAFTFSTGDLGGVIPFSRMKEFLGTGRALTRARVARFPKSAFAELLRRIPVLEQRFVSHLVDRVRDATRREAQFEKLTALGKLAAGLAHELNNPVSAVMQSMADAARRLDDRGRLTAELVGSGVSPEAVHALDALRGGAGAADGARRPRTERLDALERGDREEAMSKWLSEIGVRDGWVRAATFVDAGVDRDKLERALAAAPRAVWPAAIAWLETGLAAQTLFTATEQAAARIATLVGAMRAYTHMDRAREMTDVDVRDGIESTLALFSHRIREKGVTLVRELDDSLPRVRAFPGDLNQVWSNLLDNAIDAVAPGTGRVTIRGRGEEGMVVVEVRDDGPGIPSALADRVWEPFFTTKEVGKGTGLGLDVARRVAVDQHGGELLMTSTPGDTRFVVRLPLTTAGTFGA